MTFTHLAPVSVDITTSMVAVVTVLAALVLSLATLARPSRATITWGAAFGVGVLGAYLWLAGHHSDNAVLRAAASGILLGFEPLIWLGLRLHRHQKAPWTAVSVFVVLAPIALMLAAGTPLYLLSFHAGFLGSAVFAGLIAFELLRSQPGTRDIVLPLALASCAFVVVAIVSGFSALTNDEMSTAAQLSMLRGMNALGTVVTSTCAAFTVVLMVRAQDPADVVGGGDDEERRARLRLRKAQAQHDQSWSLLDIRLDDPEDLREASTGSAFALVLERFHQDVDDALPAAADVHRVCEARTIALLRGSEEAVHHHIREILSRVSNMDRDAAVGGVRSSASIGWAAVTAVGFDYDALAAGAAEAAERASAAGGDRWKRANGPDAPAGRDRLGVPQEPSRQPTTLER